MYTLTGEPKYLNEINRLHGKKGAAVTHSLPVKRKRNKKFNFYKRPDRDAAKRRKENQSVNYSTIPLISQNEASDTGGCKYLRSYNDFFR